MSDRKKLKKQVEPFDFESRAQKIVNKLKNNQIPTSSELRIVVPANKDGVGFQTKFYDAVLLNNMIEKEQFDSTIAEATKVCRNLWREKQREELKDHTKQFQSLLYLSVVLILIAFIFLLVLLYGKTEMVLLYLAVAILCLSTILTLIVVAKVWMLEPEFMDLDYQTMSKLTELFQHQNLSIYLQKGYKWVIEPNYYWVELQRQ